MCSSDLLPDMNRDELHALCVSLNLQRSGSKNQLLGRVAGVLGTEDGSWGRVKKSLRQGKRGAPTVAVAAEPTPATEAPTEEEAEVAEVTVIPVDTGPAPLTVDEGSGASMLELEARRAELTSQLREFLLVGRQHDEMDIAAFIDDLGRLGFGIQHAEVREHILAELTNMVSLRSEEEATSGSQPGRGREGPGGGRPETGPRRGGRWACRGSGFPRFPPASPECAFNLPSSARSTIVGLSSTPASISSVLASKAATASHSLMTWAGPMTPRPSSFQPAASSWGVSTLIPMARSTKRRWVWMSTKASH